MRLMMVLVLAFAAFVPDRAAEALRRAVRCCIMVPDDDGGERPYCFVLNGSLVFLTDLQEVRLKAGDVVVERHTFHSWRNETNDPVSMLITTVTGAA